MSRDRVAVAYVVKVDGSEVLLNLRESHRGQVAAHVEGVSAIGQPGDFLGASAGSELIVLSIRSIEFAEPREVHALNAEAYSSRMAEPLRQIKAYAMGFLRRRNGQMEFVQDEWHFPALGAEVYPLSTEELMTIMNPRGHGDSKIRLGVEARDASVAIEVPLNALLGRHVAVVGATGQGKTHFIVGLVRQILSFPRARVVIFDINGEYPPAFEGLDNVRIERTVLGDTKANGSKGFKIPYYALGRNGLFRLLLPSERTQAPALRFAIEHLQYVCADHRGAGLVDSHAQVLFDDCRSDDAPKAYEALQKIRGGTASKSQYWPHMMALSCLAAEWSCIQINPKNKTVERNSFLYGNVQTLINRIRGYLEDQQFMNIVDVEGGPPYEANALDWLLESRAVVERVFGSQVDKDDHWKLHIIDLSQLAQDLMPFVLGALLEMYASELFRRGPGGTHPTLLVLEEAHHYLRELGGDSQDDRKVLSYERLAREGRKYHLSMLVSTQRPSEISPTVLSQCGTWLVFRLTNENDQRAVAAASEPGFSYVLRQIPGLPRGRAVVFGNAVPFPCRIATAKVDPQPKSADADFAAEWGDWK